MSDKLSTVRKALMWWFHWPGNPYVSVTAAVDFTGGRAYLEQVNAEGRSKVSINHLVVAVAARVMHEFPEANAWLVGNKIRRQPHVGVAMPVNLEGHEAAVSALDFSSDGRWLASGSVDTTVRIWSLR